MSQVVEAFKFDKDIKTLEVLDQTLLPMNVEYVTIKGINDGYSVIKSMKVRGAPCIAAVGCLSIVVELNQDKELENLPITKLMEFIKSRSEYLIESRPTAVNLRNALSQVHQQCEKLSAMTSNATEFIKRLTEFCQRGISGGKELNKRLGDFGANEVMKVSGGSSTRGKLNVLTHCNTGSLATVGYGTALGVIRSLHTKGALNRAYCTETRPYNQGSRLTAWELVTEKIPATLIADSMVAYLMEKEKIDAVLVGADCVAANGDTANKIGTLQIALTAKHYQVPFYVAAPTQSVDLSIESQFGIDIEQRPGNELRCLGGIELAPSDVDVWNPCFDVTPANLISGIITEFGACKTGDLKEFVNKVKMSIKMSYEEDYAIF